MAHYRCICGVSFWWRRLSIFFTVAIQKYIHSSNSLLRISKGTAHRTPITVHRLTAICCVWALSMTREIRYFFHILSSVFLFRSENRFGNYWNFLNSCIFLLSTGRSFHFQFSLCWIFFLLVFHTATNKLVNEA